MKSQNSGTRDNLSNAAASINIEISLNLLLNVFYKIFLVCLLETNFLRVAVILSVSRNPKSPLEFFVHTFVVNKQGIQNNQRYRNSLESVSIRKVKIKNVSIYM